MDLCFSDFLTILRFSEKKINFKFSKKDLRKLNLFSQSFFIFREKIFKIFSFFPKKDFLRRFLFFWAKKDFLKRFLIFRAKKEFLKRIFFLFSKKDFLERIFCQNLFSSAREKNYWKKNLLPTPDRGVTSIIAKYYKRVH